MLRQRFFMRTMTVSSPYMALSAGILLLITAFLGISLLISHVQKNNFALLSQHPSDIVENLDNIGGAVREMKAQMEKFIRHHGEGDIKAVRASLMSLRAETEQGIFRISGYYLGARDSARELTLYHRRIDELQNTLLTAAKNTAPEHLEYIFRERLMPLYAQMATCSAAMRTFLLAFPGRLAVEHASLYTLHLWLLSAIVLLLGLFFFVLRRSHAALNHSKTQHFHDTVLKNIAEHAGTVFLLFDLKRKKMEYVSPNVFTVLGVEKSLLEEKPVLFDFCVSEVDREMGNIFTEEVLRTTIRRECLFKKPATGEECWLLVSVCPIWNANAVVRYLVSLSDMSDVKRTQQVLRDALANAQNANQSKSAFLSRMSHEIRTPMNAIIGMVTIATRFLHDRARLEDCLTKIAVSSRHLLSIVNDILDISKIESGKIAVAVEPFAFDALISNVTSTIYPQACAKQQDCNFTVNVVHEHLLGDFIKLSQILINILSNAVKYTPEGGRIRMNVRENPILDGDHAVFTFTISDTGIGMSPEFLKSLFLPFRQEHQGGFSGGTGLGMAITKNLVTMMNGAIQVESARDSGTTFVVTLELAVDEDTPSTEYRFNHLRVLIVDEDSDTYEYTATLLLRMGLRVDRAFSSEDAAARIDAAHAQNDQYRAVIMDWKRPDADGAEATQRIRSHAGLDTHIIIMAYNWTEIETDARRSGADSFISKPIFQSALQSVLASIFRIDADAQKTEQNALPLDGALLLLAEDNELNQEIARELLSVLGARIEIAMDGQEAVDMFSRSAPGTYDAVLMDIQMPRMNGYQATETIRKLAHPDAATIPIIAMTANVFNEDVTASLAAGMNGHIGKPIDLDILSETLCSALRSGREAPSK